MIAFLFAFFLIGVLVLSIVSIYHFFMCLGATLAWTVAVAIKPSQANEIAEVLAKRVIPLALCVGLDAMFSLCAIGIATGFIK